MRFLIDECLHESLVGAVDEFTFLTNNRVDFIRLFGKMELHAGLIVIITLFGRSRAPSSRRPFCTWLGMS